MGRWVLNERGFYNRGSGRSYKPVAAQLSSRISNPIGLKQRYHSAVRAKYRAEMDAVEVESRVGPRAAIEQDVGAWLAKVQQESSTVAEATATVDRRLAKMDPSMPAAVRNIAQRMMMRGEAVSPKQAEQKAIAEALSCRLASGMRAAMKHDGYTPPGGGLGALIPPIQSGGSTFSEWFASRTAGGGLLARAANTWADWTCSPADTAVGSAIVGIWLGPAGAAAAAETATEVKSALGCDLWQLAAKLKQQLAVEGTAVSREQAMQLITSGAYSYDTEADRFVRTNSFDGWWLMLRPFVPYLGLALGLWLILKVT